MTDTTDVMSAAKEAAARSDALLDPNYPLFHVAPPVGRLNDPNGLIALDGVHHAFYQYGPFFPGEKKIYWGHASSHDLVRWDVEEVALAPQHWWDRDGVYSGGATLKEGLVWLHYTGNVKEIDGTRGSYQCAATTADFTSYDQHLANPLISGPPAGYTAHIRDPFIVAEGDTYTMYLGGQREDLTGCILRFTSSDLADWEFTGELAFEDPRYQQFGFMWECPNIFRLADEATGEVLDVALFSPQGIPQQAHQFRNPFACGYVVGHLREGVFRPVGDFVELDSGFEFYAPQVFTLSPDEDDQTPRLMGWVGNANEDDQPSLRDYGWVHTLTVVRDLRLRNGRLHQIPRVGDDDGEDSLALAGSQLDGEATAVGELSGKRSFILDAEVEGGPWEIVLGKLSGPHVTFTFTREGMLVDRASTHYPLGGTRFVPLPAQVWQEGALEVTVVHDRSVTEVFVGGGHTAFTMRSYLDPDDFGVYIDGSGLVRQARARTFEAIGRD